MTSESASCRQEYWLRVNRVLDFVDAHLGERLTLDRLAEVALFSPFHFHRIFHALTGETLNACIRRMRLDKAATLLASNPDEPVTRIALACGFSSPSVLSREFRKRFGMTPTDWRRDRALEVRKIGPVLGKDGKAAPREGGYRPRDPFPPERSPTMDVEVKDLPPMRITYLRHFGPYGPGLSEAWGRFMTWAGSRGLLAEGTITLGVCPDNPEVTPPDKCRYDMGVVVEDDYRPRADENLQTLPGGRYAVHHFRGTSEQVGSAWDAFFRDWFPQSGYQPDDRPCFEICGVEEPDPETGVFGCDICVPVKPL